MGRNGFHTADTTALRRACYVNAFQIAHATMTISAAPATMSPIGLAGLAEALREAIGASPLLCLISRIIEMRIAREKVSIR